MNILGVCNANVSGASLFVDGKVLASVNEEQFLLISGTQFGGRSRKSRDQ